MKWRTLGVASSLALALSALLNVALFASSLRPPALEPAPSASARVEPPAPSAPSARLPPPPPPDSCADELERCRNQGWDLAKRVILEQSNHVAKPGEEKPTTDVTTRDQQDALCEKGLDSLREGWSRDKDKTIANLRKSLADRDEQARNADAEADKIADAIDLAQATREALARDYRKMRLARSAAVLDALGGDPPNLDGAIAALRGLFADEDALAERYGGEAARIAWRRHQVAGRTVVLAIGEAMAGRDLQEATGW